eukprot:COSAG02_NODE_6242_length_3704_cov_23.033564_3_plen_70_part_00
MAVPSVAALPRFTSYRFGNCSVARVSRDHATGTGSGIFKNAGLGSGVSHCTGTGVSYYGGSGVLKMNQL